MNHLKMMRLAESVALQSVCKRAQVGAVVITQSGGQYTGYNHNRGYCCEGADGRTLKTVIHAEADALLSASGFSGGNARGATLYVTRQPCIECAKRLTLTGIKTVYYRDRDDKTDGIMYLLEHGVAVDSRWIKGQMRAQTLEQVQKTWADRSQSACDACPQNGDGVCCGGVV
jgi:dCMP deaminase